MTEYQGYRTKTAHDMAVISAAVKEMMTEPLTAKPIHFAKNVKIQWRDPSPIRPLKGLLGDESLDDWRGILADMEATHRQTQRYYGNAWVTRYMAGMEPPRDTGIVDSFPNPA